MQKAKREDFQVEEELRIQKAKYEETNEDVYRRMQDVRTQALNQCYPKLTEALRSKRRKLRVSLIWEHFLMLKSTITTVVVMFSCK